VGGWWRGTFPVKQHRYYLPLSMEGKKKGKAKEPQNCSLIKRRKKRNEEEILLPICWKSNSDARKGNTAIAGKLSTLLTGVLEKTQKKNLNTVIEKKIKLVEAAKVTKMFWAEGADGNGRKVFHKTKRST